MVEANPVKVLHFASGDLWAGAEVQLFTLVKELDNNPDIAAAVILLNHGKLEQELRGIGVDVTVINEEKLNSVKILLQLIRTLRKTSPQVIHTHRQKENIIGSVAAYFGGRIPIIRTVHGAPERIPAWKQLPKKAIQIVYWFCGRFMQDKIVAVSKDLSNILEKKFPSGKIVTIENGINIKEIRNHLIKNQVDTKKQSDTYNIGIAGRLVPVKRVDVFIKTAHYIVKNYPQSEIIFHIYGDGPLRSELELLNRKLGTNAAVIFHGHCDNLYEKLQHLDALLITSDHEGLPMILLEAMVCETPIVAHAVGGIPNLLDHGRCGILVNENTASAFAKKIKLLMDNANDHHVIISNALSRVTDCYSSQINALKYYEEYKLLTNR